MAEEEASKKLSPLTFQMARSGAIELQQKYTKSTKRRECPNVFIVFDFIKPPKSSKGPINLTLPHPVRMFPFQSGVVFVGGESVKWQEAFDKTELKLKAISMSALQKHYSSRKEQDQLFTSTDYFFAEKGVASQLPKKLGNKFFSRNRQPTQVSLDISNPEQIYNEIKNSIQGTQFYIPASNECWVRAGGFNLSFDHLAENIAICSELAMQEIPKAKARVKSIHLYASGIAMPPIWEKDAKKITLTAEEIKTTRTNEEQ
ncbi:hypothetical protein TVAG_055950 [Trichomonas vaginalis G3]|uniref:Uncharacterized protein n=1 Tax=Trichomonas vaginalis (strain ATCC PRA-98 / G3) TaxID=412133 RepID=A2EL48_TRIV3|nr:regulation of cellular senescence [Trichomonas vaginalis G3]EAY06601.1 hypothetical protein TVAG_055950 [Trichomonas vaginalis G3]KAI5551643.1 regulation of cellular senescence [Trichomonas vaginalis G3]|eukprot:XP_001318824.1 hypothetical protein [Trichomonas vaginalis G3]